MQSDDRRKSDQELSKRVLALELGQTAIRKLLAENTEVTLRVESNTAPLVSLANQLASTGHLFSRVSGILRAILKVLLVFGITIGVLLAGGYALTHDGHLPGWFKELFRLWREVD